MSLPSSVLVATDGREQSDGAIRAGAWLAGTGASWRILTAVPPIPVVSPDLDLQLTADSIDAALENVRRSVDGHLQRVLGQAASIQVDVRSGNAADMLCASGACERYAVGRDVMRCS